MLSPIGRRSVRLRTHDYACGSYFITICTANRIQLFGNIREESMFLSKAGYAARHEWQLTDRLRSNVALDAFIVMSDHVHLIIHITQTHLVNDGKPPIENAQPPIIGRGTPWRAHDMTPDPGGAIATIESRGLRGTPRRAPTSGVVDVGDAVIHRRFGGSIPDCLPTVVSAFKSAVTRSMRRMGYEGPVWQRNYWDHIIRNDDELWDIREYIRLNPVNWEK